MTKLQVTRVTLVLGALFLMQTVAQADDPPPWLKQAAATSLPTYGKEVHAVVLHDESIKKIEEDGKIIPTTWWAVRILAREGRGMAKADEAYTTG